MTKNDKSADNGRRLDRMLGKKRAMEIAQFVENIKQGAIKKFGGSFILGENGEFIFPNGDILSVDISETGNVAIKINNKIFGEKQFS